MSKFRLELRFSGLSVLQARGLLDEMDFSQDITVNGFWHILEDEDAHFALIGDKIVCRSESGGPSPLNRRVLEYSGKLFTPIIKGSDIPDVTRVINKLYEAGAVVLSTSCVKIHFLGNYHSLTAAGIVSKLVKANKLFLTMLFFPRTLSPLWTPIGGCFHDASVKAAASYYRDVIDGIFREKNGTQLACGLIADLMQKHTEPEKPGICKTRFDSDSSLDSKG